MNVPVILMGSLIVAIPLFTILRIKRWASPNPLIAAGFYTTALIAVIAPLPAGLINPIYIVSDPHVVFGTVGGAIPTVAALLLFGFLLKVAYRRLSTPQNIVVPVFMILSVLSLAIIFPALYSPVGTISQAVGNVLGANITPEPFIYGILFSVLSLIGFVTVLRFLTSSEPLSIEKILSISAYAAIIGPLTAVIFTLVIQDTTGEFITISTAIGLIIVPLSVIIEVVYGPQESSTQGEMAYSISK